MPLPTAEHKTEIAWSQPFDFLGWHRPMPRSSGATPFHRFPISIPNLQLQNVGSLILRVGGQNKMELTAGLELNLGDIQTAFENYHPAERFVYLKITAELWSYSRKAYVDMKDHTGWKRISAERLSGGEGQWRPEQSISWTYDAEHPMISSQVAAYSADFIYSQNNPIGVRYSMLYTTELS